MVPCHLCGQEVPQSFLDVHVRTPACSRPKKRPLLPSPEAHALNVQDPAVPAKKPLLPDPGVVVPLMEVELGPSPPRALLHRPGPGASVDRRPLLPLPEPRGLLPDPGVGRGPPSPRSNGAEEDSLSM